MRRCAQWPVNACTCLKPSARSDDFIRMDDPQLEPSVGGADDRNRRRSDRRRQDTPVADDQRVANRRRPPGIASLLHDMLRFMQHDECDP
jgi:hypothetical protein